jgi:hypothetical protein
MITLNEACDQVGYVGSAKCPIEPKSSWFAYKGGKSVECASKNEALNYSKNIEQVVLNKDEILLWKKEQSRKWNEAISVWKDALFRDHKGVVSDEILQLCYNRAYDSCHSEGFDLVATKLEDEIEYALQIINAVNRDLSKKN